MATTDDTRIQAVFQTVILEFKKNLGNDELYAEILKTKTIDQVYDLTDKLQEEQQKTGRLRHLSKIGPYLERLRDYAGAIEVFVQAKPDILALIWGPIKLLIQWTSTLKQSFDAIINTTAQIGSLLPEFKEAALMFGHNACLNEVLALFFQDILDFYIVALQFFSSSRWRIVFEAMWPSRKDKIAIIMSHVEQHAGLMRNEVRREDIRAEHEARRRALQHFEKMEKSAIQQEFNAIQTHISPTFFDDTLNRIESRLCDGTGKWLLKDSTFCKWLDASNKSTRQMWLQGIPGAGKTFLSATAIRHSMTYGKTIFAYLTHSSSSSTTALSVFHSLIFQLAQDDHDLQTLLCQLGRKNLKNDLKVATEMLQHLLNYAGLVYIILDGIDEIMEVERDRLLRHLIQLVEGCDDTRILISSRPEADIRSRLDPEFESIRINDRNSGSIQAFVTYRTKQWLLARGFLPKDQADIETLLAPLASKAKGMFLYAEVVLNTIKNLEREEILEELSILPEDLDAAYLRILKRINNLKSPDVEKARNILGWIGCSPTPLTIYEMEQALRVTADQDSTSRVSSRLDAVSLCGPIIEVNDDFIGFVHFTVKEYLFSPQVSGYIDLTEATLNLANRCIWYLCQAHHDPWIEDDEIEANIVSGAYRLHYYASSKWLELLECYIKLNGRDSLSLELISALNVLFGRRTKWGFEPSFEPDRSDDMLRSQFEGFKEISPELYAFLCHVAQFRRSCTSLEYHIHQREEWATSDPLIISEVSAMLHERSDQLSCPKDRHNDNCHCSLLQWHYGDRRFRCGFIGCPIRHRGFSTKSKRDGHEKNHTRQWKCIDPSCEYSEIGFLSRRMRDEHSESHCQGHKPNASKLSFDADELQPLLFDLISCDDVDAVRPLIPKIKTLHSGVIKGLCMLAAFSASVSMIKLLHEAGILAEHSHESATASIRGNNEDVLALLLSLFPVNSSNTIRPGILGDLLESESTTAFEISRQFLFESLTNRQPRSLIPAESYSYSHYAIKATRRMTYREGVLLGLWKDLAARKENSGFFDKRYLGDALGSVADTTCSITLARQLIEYGAFVDARRSDRYLTPLHRAARRSSAESAELIKFLLYEGADPNAESGRSPKRIDQERCTREITKWLGISWEELIEKVKMDKEKGIGWPGS